jgi:DNA-directed RNA polymerase sigma subunit (sigma70/sigma32)
MTNQFPPRLIETVNRLVRMSRQMMREIGREPTTEKLAERLSMPLEKVAKLFGHREKARQDRRTVTTIDREENPGAATHRNMILN